MVEHTILLLFKYLSDLFVAIKDEAESKVRPNSEMIGDGVGRAVIRGCGGELTAVAHRDAGISIRAEGAVPEAVTKAQLSINAKCTRVVAGERIGDQS